MNSIVASYYFVISNNMEEENGSTLEKGQI